MVSRTALGYGLLWSLDRSDYDGGFARVKRLPTLEEWPQFAKLSNAWRVAK